MFFDIEQRRPRLPRLLSLAIYVVSIAFAGLVTALGAERVAVAVFSQMSATSTPARQAKTQQAVAPVAPNPRAQTLRREAQLVPTADRWNDGDRPRRRGYPAFGSSSRGSPPFFRGWGEEEDMDDRRERMASSGYRTVCVRTCDGYYFPISFSTTRESFAKDSRTCESKCGGQARLFVHPNPGGDVENMVDLQGRPYRQLPTAFLYRTQYVAACKCQPDPWDSEAKERHRVYALIAAKSKGSKDAAQELKEIEAKARQAARTTGKVAALPGTGQPPGSSTPGMPEPRTPDTVRKPALGPDGEPIMRLGAEAAPKPRQAPPPQVQWGNDRGSWQRRALRLD